MIELDITEQNDYCHLIGPLSDGLYCIEFYHARMHIREDKKCVKIAVSKEYLDKICENWLGSFKEEN